jgi:hypothetical protein
MNGVVNNLFVRNQKLRHVQVEIDEHTQGSFSGFSKLLHWLRHNPDKRERFVTAVEHCDYVVTTSLLMYTASPVG